MLLITLQQYFGFAKKRVLQSNIFFIRFSAD
jgi:hypothetical protein